jgi:hypothetical protein
MSAARVLTVLGLAALIAGCGGSERVTVPDGFKELDGPTYTFAHPAGWQGITAEDTLGAQGPKGTGGLAPQAAVASNEGPGVGIDLIVDGFKADQMTRRGNWKIVREEPVEVEGARDARLIEARYDEGTTPVRTIDLFALTEEGMLYDFVVRAPAADFERLRLPEIIDTFRLK